MPKVSVVMPTFNSERYVEESVLSVLAQSEPDLELILADDGSTDGTMAVVNRLAAKDRRIVICPPSRTGSAGAARNRGLARAQGQYICFLDDDDLYHPDKISCTVPVLDSFPQVGAVFHDFVSFTGSPDGKPGHLAELRFAQRAADRLEEVSHATYLCDEDFYAFMSVHLMPFHTSALMFGRALLDSGALHFREDLRVGHDVELWLRIARHCRVAFADRVLSYYRQRSGSLTSDSIQQMRDSIQVHRENLERGKAFFTEQQVRLCRSTLAVKLFDLGYACFTNNDVSEARMAYQESLNIRFSVRTLAAYLKTLAPETIVRSRYRFSGKRS